jgi:hypothetical protein
MYRYKDKHMKIGFIGTGNIGGTIARKLVAAGHSVRVASAESLEDTRAFAESIGAAGVETSEIAKDADVLIISVPTPAVAELGAHIFSDAPANLIVVDTGNYYPGLRDAHIQEIEDGMAESLWVSAQIGRPVIKAFGNLLAYSLAENGRPAGASDRIAMAVAGDDPAAKEVVMKLVNDAGFDPVDAGSLAESWRQQPGTPAYCTDYDQETLRAALAAATRSGAGERRDHVLATMGERGWNLTHDEIIALNRSVNPIK